MDEQGIERHLTRQRGLINRYQVLAAGGDDLLIERRVRRREWARVLPGVYVDHTGPLDWEQRAWAAVLRAWPAALTGDSALRAFGARPSNGRDPQPAAIHIAIARERRFVGPDWVTVMRIDDYDERVLDNLSPPRVRMEEALLVVAAAEADNASALAVLADACQSGRTTAGRLVAALGTMTRQRGRAFLLEVLDDVAQGAYSVLEQRYLDLVERAHGLPDGERQQRVDLGSRCGFRDVAYPAHAAVVELDGRLGHESARDRWRDLERDLLGAVHGQLTIRIGWAQVLEPCRLAGWVAELLAQRGWSGTSRPCGPGCRVNGAVDSGGGSAPGADHAPLSA